MIRAASISLYIWLVLATAAAQYAPPAAEPEWDTLSQALAEAAESGRPVLVYIRAAWCGPCRRLERETFADPAVTGLMGRFVLARLTFDDRDRSQRVGPYRLSEADWAARLGAETTPTLVFLAPDGAVLGRHSGFLPPAGLFPLLDAASAGALAWSSDPG